MFCTFKIIMQKNARDPCVGQYMSQQIFHTSILYRNKTLFAS